MNIPDTAREAIQELRSVCPQYKWPRFDILAKVITDELEGKQDVNSSVTIERHLDPFPQGKLL